MKFGGLCERSKHNTGELYSVLQWNMIGVKTAIYCLLSSKISKLHLCLVNFDLLMLQEVLQLLHKEILGRTWCGLEFKEKPGSVAITDCGEFKKQLGGGEAKLIINDETMGTLVYNAKEILRAKFYYGNWNCCWITGPQLLYLSQSDSQKRCSTVKLNCIMKKLNGCGETCSPRTFSEYELIHRRL